ncbi:Nn.00g106340.m01.CDS01 [Neocucurbitaria sp. VM-36]
MSFSFARRQSNRWNSQPVPDIMIFHYRLQDTNEGSHRHDMATLKILLESQYQEGEAQFEYGGPSVHRDKFIYVSGSTFGLPGWTNQVPRAKLDLRMGSSSYYPVKETTEIAGLLPLVKAWIHDCTTNHQPCNRDMHGKLPTRVLDVGLEGEVCVKLHVTTQAEQGQYATLSHCWGRKQIFRLTSESERSLIDGVLLSQLPKTFVDAIVTTRAIGLKYLWIDSLCIIQDSAEDWKAESSRMGDIYRNCYINLAATAASDGDGGLFQSRCPAIIPPIRFNLPTEAEKPRWLVCWPNDLWKDNVECSILSTRGWVFQERLMSPRILHFSDQVFWECRMSNACETVPTGCPNIEPENIAQPFTHFLESVVEICQSFDQARSPFRDKPRPRALLRDWDNVVSVYSQKLFTKYNDRLIAFSGIVDEMQKALVHVGRKNDFYMCGLWSSQMPFELMWRVGFVREKIEVCESKRVEVVGLPSWSWASVIGPIIPCSWHRIYGSETARVVLNHIVLYSIGLATATTPGTEDQFFLELQAILLPLGSLDFLGMRVWNEVEDNPAPDAGGSTTVILGPSDPILATVYPDDQQEYARYAAADLMFAIPIVTSGMNGDLEGLLIIRVDDPDSSSPEMQNFRRLGIFSADAMVRGTSENMQDSYQAFASRRDEVIEEILGLDQRTIRLW